MAGAAIAGVLTNSTTVATTATKVNERRFLVKSIVFVREDEDGAWTKRQWEVNNLYIFQGDCIDHSIGSHFNSLVGLDLLFF